MTALGRPSTDPSLQTGYHKANEPDLLQRGPTPPPPQSTQRCASARHPSNELGALQEDVAGVWGKQNSPEPSRRHSMYAEQPTNSTKYGFKVDGCLKGTEMTITHLVEPCLHALDNVDEDRRSGVSRWRRRARKRSILAGWRWLIS